MSGQQDRELLEQLGATVLGSEDGMVTLYTATKLYRLACKLAAHVASLEQGTELLDTAVRVQGEKLRSRTAELEAAGQVLERQGKQLAHVRGRVVRLRAELVPARMLARHALQLHPGPVLISPEASRLVLADTPEEREVALAAWNKARAEREAAACEPQPAPTSSRAKLDRCVHCCTAPIHVRACDRCGAMVCGTCTTTTEAGRICHDCWGEVGG